MSVSTFEPQVTIGSRDLKANHAIQQKFEFPDWDGEKYPLLVNMLQVMYGLILIS